MTKKSSKIWLYSFGAVDAINLIYYVVVHPRLFYLDFSPISNWAFLSNILVLFVTVSFVFSAYGLIRQRKWALYLSCLQFPFRFFFYLPSFLVLLSPLIKPLLNYPSSETQLMVMLVLSILEIARLIITVLSYRTLRN